jgi:hypothetical protein
MPLADKSRIPISVHDIKVVAYNDEPRIRDVRLALRLGFARLDQIRKLIDRYRVDLERYGNLFHRGTNSIGAGRPATEFWLTKGQAIFICVRSEAKHANEILHELIAIFLAFDTKGERPATPTIDALVAPDRPSVQHDGNVAYLQQQEPEQQELAFNEVAQGNTQIDYFNGYRCKITIYDSRPMQLDIDAPDLPTEILIHAIECGNAILRDGLPIEKSCRGVTRGSCHPLVDVERFMLNHLFERRFPS